MVAVLPLSVDAQAVEPYLWSNFSSPGTQLTVAYALSSLHIRNESGAETTVTFLQSNGLGGTEAFEIVTVDDGADWVMSYFPFMRMQGSILQPTYTGGGASGLSIGASIVSLGQLRI
jgi:hypothetical protein